MSFSSRGAVRPVRACVPVFALSTVVVGMGVGGLAGCTVYRPTIDNPAGDGAYVSTPRQTGAAGLVAGEDRAVTMPAIALLEPGKLVYRIANLPPEQWHLTLELDEPSSEKLDAIDAAGVRVSISLRNERTGAVTMKEGRLLGDWNTTLESWSGTPVIYDALWFRPKRHDVFYLTVEVMPTTPSTSTSVTATPRITNDPR